jgi:predicted MFS family arabinose efflux permease
LSGAAGTTNLTGSSSPKQRITKWLIFVGAVVMLAGLLFGYDQGVIGGALAGIEKTFNPSTTVVEIITSWVTLGALFGALVAGTMAERLGRRMTVIWAAVLFTAGALIESFAPSTWVMVIGRLVVGVGVGVASLAAPLYAAESGAFLLFAIICLITYVFVWKLQPETKGRSLEQIQQMWEAKATQRDAATRPAR